MECHFLTPCAINIENGRAGKARVFLKQTKWLSVFVKSSEETSVLSPRETDHTQFRDHDRPTEDRCNSKKSEDNFPCDRRVIERKQQTAAGSYDFRNEHFRVTGISNNAVLRKRHPKRAVILSAAKRSRRILQNYFRVPPRDFSTSLGMTICLFGNVGCLFAATMYAIPMATRKNEKNWPRVNGPINSASGSRKFSTASRKIA